MCPSPPSAATLSKDAVLVDAAHCLYWKAKLCESNGPIWLWADSSELVGREWLLSMYDFIETKENLLAAFDASHSLLKATDAFLAAGPDGTDPEPSTWEHVTQRSASGALLRKLLKRHRQLPMAMGSGRTDLDTKCKLITLKFFFEANTPQATAAVMARVKAVCTDMGTEAGMADVTGITSAEYLPDWMQETQAGLEDDVHPRIEGDDGPPSNKFLPFAVLSAGICHICDNMCKEVDAQLSWWEPWLEGFKPVCYIMSKAYLRRRLVATCFTGRYSAMASLFKTGVASPAKWRWGFVVHTIPQILKLKRALQAGWNASAFKNFAASREEGQFSAQDSKEVNLEAATSAIHSQQWWVYTEMLLAVHLMSGNFQAECEGCHCHTWLRDPAHLQRRESLLAARQALADQLPCLMDLSGGPADGEGFHCPLSGKVAVKLASGRLAEFLRHASEGVLAELVISCIGLPDRATDLVVSDFKLAQAHIIKYLTEKLEFWQRLPWKLAALGDWVPGKAAAAAKAITTEFDKAPQDPHLHHKLTWQFLQPGSRVRAELDQFASGASLDELLVLKEKVAEMFFTPVSERCQEGDHSIVNRYTASRLTVGPYISNRIRYPQLVQECFPDTRLCKEYLQCLDTIRVDPARAVQQLGLNRHPLMADALRRLTEPGKKKRAKEEIKRVLACILYSADVESQYASSSKHRSKREAANKALKRKADQFRDSCLPSAKHMKVTVDTIREACILKHMASTMKPGGLYSIPVGGATLTSHSEAFAPAQSARPILRAGSATADAESGLEMDVGEQLEDSGAQAATAKLGHKAQFFRLVQGGRGHKHVPVAPASGSQPPRNTLCLQLHSAMLAENALLVSADLVGSASGSDMLTMLPAVGLDLDAVESKATAWKRKGRAAFFFKGLEHLVGNPTIDNMVRSGSFSEEHAFVVKSADHSAALVLDQLRRLGLATCTQQGTDATAWVFTQVAARTLGCAHEVHRPTPLFQRPPAGLALHEQTPYHWLLALQEQGWAWQLPPAKALRHMIQPFERGGPKVWYYSGNDLARVKQYIWSLLKCEDLFSQGTLKRIYHCRHAGYYVRVLKGNFDGEPPVRLPAPDAAPALEDDTGADDHEHPGAADEPQVIRALPPLVHGQALDEYVSALALQLLVLKPRVARVLAVIFTKLRNSLP
jgi:hypothetical protein